MRGPEHVTFAALTTGAALWLTSQGHLDLTLTAASMGAAAVGSLVPDIDHKQAWISARIPWSLISAGGTFLALRAYGERLVAHDSAGIYSVLAEALVRSSATLTGWAWLALMVGIALLLVSWMVRLVAGHRGPTHSLAVAAATTLAACAILALVGLPVRPGLWFGWGYVSHLVTDGLTPKRCPALLWPMGRATPAAARTAPEPNEPREQPLIPEPEGYQQN